MVRYTLHNLSNAFQGRFLTKPNTQPTIHVTRNVNSKGRDYIASKYSNNVDKLIQGPNEEKEMNHSFAELILS